MTQACGEQCGAHQFGQVVPLEQAVGMVLANDVTEIVPGIKKGPAFRKGHVVGKEDLQHLARLGKRHLFVLEIKEDHLHENDAAVLMAEALSGPGVAAAAPPVEGKITLTAQRDGIFQVDPSALKQFNLVPDVMCATIHRRTPVKAGQALAGTRAIPLVVERRHIEMACCLAGRGGGILRVDEVRPCLAGVVVTGNEVAGGLIQDRFAPVIRKKIAALGGSLLQPRIVPDDRLAVAHAITAVLEQGADLVITTAGMSVDPDDVTRLAIADAGGKDLVYGAPVLPGAMFLLGRLWGPRGEVPVLGVPACALFHEATILDLILPRILAGEKLSRDDIASLGHGGYCWNCAEGCRFPCCAFGKSA